MKLVPISELFEVKYGVNLELNRLSRDPGGINFVSRSAKNNGVTGRVKLLEDVKPIEAGVLTVAGGGSVLETFVQTEQFYSGRDLYYLRPRVDLTLEQKLYYCMCTFHATARKSQRPSFFLVKPTPKASHADHLRA